MLNTKVWWVSQGKTLVSWVSSWRNQFFHGTPSLLKRMTDRWTTAIQTWITARHFLKVELSWACYFKKINWRNLLHMIKFKFTSKSWNFRKPVLPTMSMTASQYRGFSNRMVGDINEWFLHQRLEDCHYSVNQLFSKSLVHDVTKSYLSKKDPHKVSHRQINFDVTEYEKLINMAFKFYIATNC